MSNLRKFLTGSQFVGNYMENIERMNGIGRYVYPDGTEYHGLFNNGKFHGYGRIKLKTPSKIIFKGIFNNGKLEEIDEIIFSDGLRVDHAYDGSSLSLENLDYCSQNDRRYCVELRWGLQPVGPYAHLTKDISSRPLPKDCYDTEEGIYSTNTGFISKREKPWKPSRFVACRNEIEWIKKYCRRAEGYGDDFVTEVLGDTNVCHDILKTNMEAMAALRETYQCVCNENLRNNLNCRLKKRFDKNVSNSDLSSSDIPMSVIASSMESFEENPLQINLKERVERLHDDIYLEEQKGLDDLRKHLVHTRSILSNVS